ncbi:hypothetical protein [uncultured Alsobacter sp.]|uniref:hypothetical protein n=1 Tax=uncultured Alsobacter sp. TaxID=1748258 RepID=UPI0025E8B1A4|nr:hypothetical protein [uncultured Alsobacter sp.]
MTSLRKAALATIALLATTPVFGQARPETRYTRFDLAAPSCKPAQQAEAFSCQGMAGWSIAVGYPAFGATLAFVSKDKPARVHQPADDRSVAIDGLAGPSTTVEWRGVVRNGTFQPYAAIVRILAVDAATRQAMIEAGAPPPSLKRAQVLLVTRLAAEGSCVVAYVDAQANPNANDLARTAADAAALTPCPVPHAAIVGARTNVLASYLD